MKTLAVGAEAIIKADESKKLVLKQRQPKKYRVKELDEKLRLHRMRREAKVIEALQQLGIPVPRVMSADEKTATITMQLIEGKKVRDALGKGNYIGICGEIGKAVGVMHSSDIVHGDLTTSNMILSSGNKGAHATRATSRLRGDCAQSASADLCLINPDQDKVYFVDFGLSSFSNREEDKAVDLHLFRQALNSSHSGLADECFAAAITAYKGTNRDWQPVLRRLEKVEERGRNKGKNKPDQAENM